MSKGVLCMAENGSIFKTDTTLSGKNVKGIIPPDDDVCCYIRNSRQNFTDEFFADSVICLG
mgnify:CR=1 FL=1